MVHPVEQLRAALGRILGSDADEAVVAALYDALTESVCGVLDQLATVRRLLLFFNLTPDWSAVLGVIRETLNVDAVQVGYLDSKNELEWHMLPADYRLDKEFANLVQNGLAFEDQSPEGRIRRLGRLLSVKDDLMGMMIVTRIQGRPFDDCERVILDYFADELASTLHHLDLYRLVRAQADRLASLLYDHPEDEADPSA